MSIQPIDHGATMPAPVLPAMPATNGAEDPKPLPKARPTRTEAVRIAKAKIMRRNSLRMQRKAQKE
jgi:hypothetical protein